MKIVLVVNSFPTISEIFIFRKAVMLAEYGHDVHVIAGQNGSWDAFEAQLPLPTNLSITYLTEDLASHRYTLLKRSWWTALSLVKNSPSRLIQLIITSLKTYGFSIDTIKSIYRHLNYANLDSDVIHCEFLGIAAALPLLQSINNKPVILSCRGADLHLLAHQNIGKRNRYIKQLQDVAAVHCVSQEMANEVKLLSDRVTNVKVIKPAVDTSKIGYFERQPISTSPHIVSVGRLVWKKGFDYLLNALMILNSREIAFRATIIGDGPLRSHLEEVLSIIGLDSQVQFLGAQPSEIVLNSLQTADLFVLASHEEGISNAVLEAMASGVPIVTTDAGGMVEAIRDGIDGFVVPTRDYVALANKMELLLKSEPLRKAMGLSSRIRVELEFDLKRQAKEFERFYRETVESWNTVN
jgi:colanic acid/amylovoran biosynthesis glycosyltransferase